MTNPNWVQNLWNGFGSKLQPMYKKIDEWDCPGLRELCKGLWNIMSDKYKKFTYELAINLYKDFGQTKAEELMVVITRELGKIFKVEN